MPSAPERRKMLQYNRDRGLGFRMTAEEAAPAHRKITSFRKSGMSYQQMGQVSGVACSTITVFAKYGQGSKNGKGGLYRTHYDALMRMEFQAAVGSHAGARDATAAILGARRLNALRASGWPIATIVEMLPVYNAANVRLLCIGECTSIGPVVADAIRALYDKIQFASPSDYGVSITSQKKARHYAKGAPTVDCWDEDTIDDPDALPEWTGACGTEEGYRIHIRETIFNKRPLPLCDPCRAAVEVYEPNGTFRVALDRARLEQALAESPLKIGDVAEKVFGDLKRGRDVLYRWRDGSRSPRYMGDVDKLADVLGVEPSFLVDETETEERRDRATRGKGDFNPHVLRAALDMASLSQCAATKLPGCTVTKGSINTWVQGKSKPQTKDKIKFLADHFGIDIETFYS